MKSLIEVDYNILNEYKNFTDINEGNWNIGAYVNTFYDTNTAIAFSKLFFPDFVTVKNCVLLQMRYDETIFNRWYNEFDKDISSVEKMCNLYELSDFFHINDNTNVDNYFNQLITFGNVLKRSLELNLTYLFKDRKFSVELFEEYDSFFITFYTIHALV